MSNNAEQQKILTGKGQDLYGFCSISELITQ